MSSIKIYLYKHDYFTITSNILTLFDIGTDIFTVIKLLGHKNLQTTQVYAKIVDKTKVEAINRMPELWI